MIDRGGRALQAWLILDVMAGGAQRAACMAKNCNVAYQTCLEERRADRICQSTWSCLHTAHPASCGSEETMGLRDCAMTCLDAPMDPESVRLQLEQLKVHKKTVVDNMNNEAIPEQPREEGPSINRHRASRARALIELRSLSASSLISSSAVDENFRCKSDECQMNHNIYEANIITQWLSFWVPKIKGVCNAFVLAYAGVQSEYTESVARLNQCQSDMEGGFTSSINQLSTNIRTTSETTYHTIEENTAEYEESGNALQDIQNYFLYKFEEVREEQEQKHNNLVDNKWNTIKSAVETTLDSLHDSLAGPVQRMGALKTEKTQLLKDYIGDENAKVVDFINNEKTEAVVAKNALRDSASSALSAADLAHANMKDVFTNMETLISEAESARTLEASGIDSVYESEMDKIDGTADLIAGHLEAGITPLRDALNTLDNDGATLWAPSEEASTVVADTNVSGAKTNNEVMWRNEDVIWKSAITSYTSKLTEAETALKDGMDKVDGEIAKIDDGVFESTKSIAKEVNEAKVNVAQLSGNFVDNVPANFSNVTDDLNTEAQTYLGQIYADQESLNGNLSEVKQNYSTAIEDEVRPRVTGLEGQWESIAGGARTWQKALEIKDVTLADQIAQWQTLTLANLDQLQVEFTGSARKNKARLDDYIDDIRTAGTKSRAEVDRVKQKLDVEAGLKYDKMMKLMRNRYEKEEADLKPTLVDTSSEIGELITMLKESKATKKKLYGTLQKDLGTIAARVPDLYDLHDTQQTKIDSIMDAYREMPNHLIENLRNAVEHGATALKDSVATDLRNEDNKIGERLAHDLATMEAKVQTEQDSVKAVDEKIREVAAGVDREQRNLKTKITETDDTLLASVRRLDDKILAAGKAGQAVNYDDALNAECDQQKAQLESIVRGYVSQVSEEADAKFRKAMQERQDALDAIMRGAAGSFNTLKNKLRAADQEMAEVLRLVLKEQKKSEETMEIEKTDQQKNKERLDKSLAAVQKELGADKLLVIEDETAQRDALDKRARKVKSALLKDLGEVSSHVEHEMDRLQQEANAKIIKILADESLTDEEKRKKIEQLDAETRLALTTLYEEQVMAEQRITNWAEENSAASLEADDKLENFEKVLKAEQLQWLKDMLVEKIELRDQANSLVNVCDGLLKTLEDEKKANGGELSARRLKQLQILAGLREQLKPLLAEREEAAEEAKKIAWLVAARASGDVSEEELLAVEQELDAIGEAWRGKNGSLKERLTAAGKERREAADHDMAFLGGTLLSIFGKVSDLMKVVQHARDATFIRQRAVQDKVRRMQQRLMEASGVDEETFKRKLMQLREKDIHEQQQVTQKLHDAEVEAGQMLDDEDADRTMVNEISKDAAEGSKIGDKASELAAMQTEEQLRAASKQFQDVALSDVKKAESEAQSITKPQQQWLTEMRGEVDGIAARTVQEHGRIEGTTEEKIALLNSNNDMVLKGAEHLGGRVSVLDGELTNLMNMVEKQQQRAIDAVDATAAAIGHVVAPPAALFEQAPSRSDELAARVEQLNTRIADDSIRRNAAVAEQKVLAHRLQRRRQEQSTNALPSNRA